MDYTEAKKLNAEGKAVYRASWDGCVWNAGGMRDVGDTIGYYATEEEAQAACRDFELIDFDREHCYTSVELCDAGEFDD